ncbi:hypothetical protein [Microbacterium aerolatum]|uniref:hypothetical protein n=1 Tax=Microbacterium aerolatum TaxID=153731 RepID=UPI00384C0A1B
MDVLTFFANTTVRDIGAVAIVALVVMMILTGRLLPRSTHESQLAAANKRGDEWKETADMRGDLIQTLTAQNSTLIEATKTPAEFFGTVMREGGGNRVAETNTPSP